MYARQRRRWLILAVEISEWGNRERSVAENIYHEETHEPQLREWKNTVFRDQMSCLLDLEPNERMHVWLGCG